MIDDSLKPAPCRILVQGGRIVDPEYKPLAPPPVEAPAPPHSVRSMDGLRGKTRKEKTK